MKGAAQYREVQRTAANEVIAQHSDLVRRIAHHLAARLPASVEVDDLIQAGMMGLIEASRSYDADQGASFETYASIRIRGSMIDEIRRGDWVPRSVHRRARDAAATIRRLEQSTGRAASATEVAAAMEMPLPEYLRLMEDASRGQVLSLESRIEDQGELDTVAQGGPTPQQVLNAASSARAGQCHRPPARARTAGAVALLRAGTEFEGDRRSARRERVAGLPDPRPGGPAPAWPTEDFRGGRRRPRELINKGTLL